MRALTFPLLRTLSLYAIAATLISGCGNKDELVVQAEKKDVPKGVAAPSIEQTKAIAAEGFIYGLPLVMNYTAIYELFLDKTSSQYRCPMNQIFNEHRTFTCKDTAVVMPNSDTSSSFVCLDFEPSLTCSLFLPCQLSATTLFSLLT